jgi:hypothetical protein
MQHTVQDEHRHPTNNFLIIRFGIVPPPACHAQALIGVPVRIGTMQTSAY